MKNPDDVKAALLLVGFKEMPAGTRIWWYRKGLVDVYYYAPGDDTECAVSSIPQGYISMCSHEVIDYLIKEELI